MLLKNNKFKSTQCVKAQSESSWLAALVPEILSSDIKCVSELCTSEQEALEVPSVG